MKDSHVGALLEDLDHKFDTIIESLSFMATKADVEKMREDHEQWMRDHEI